MTVFTNIEHGSDQTAVMPEHSTKTIKISENKFKKILNLKTVLNVYLLLQ